MFSVTDSERVIDDHPTRPSTKTLGKWKERKNQMEYVNDRTWPYHGMSPNALKVRASVLNKIWKDHISDKNGLGGDTAPYVRRPFAAVPKATFSCAMATMDKVEGWKEEEWVRSYLAASMWIYTKAVLWEGRKRDPSLDLQPTLTTIIESVSWVIEDLSVGSRMDHGNKGYHERKSHSEGTALRHRSAMPSSVGFAVVFSTDKPQPQVREQRNESDKIQGHSQQFNRVNV